MTGQDMRFLICALFFLASLPAAGAGGAAFASQGAEAPEVAREAGERQEEKAQDRAPADPDAAAVLDASPGDAYADIPLDEDMRKAKADYDEALRDLTPEQLAALGELEAEFSSIMDIDMQILHRSGEMEHCLSSDRFFKADQNRHVRHFVDWRNRQKEEQKKLQAAHRIKWQKIDYVPLRVLNDYYYVYQSRLLMIIGATVARDELRGGGFRGTDCDDLARRLAQGE